MVDKYGTGQDPYCYKNTDILINKFNIRDGEILQEAEREITTVSLKEVSFFLPPYNLGYYQKIHFILFSSIYNWAGEIRSIDISKQDTRFCIHSRIEAEAHKLFDSLEKRDYLVNDEYNKFISSLAELYADLNMIHPFRDGNGRVQRILFEHIALNCEYVFDWSVASTDKWTLANIHGVNCNFAPLEKIFHLALKKIT